MCVCVCVCVCVSKCMIFLANKTAAWVFAMDGLNLKDCSEGLATFCVIHIEEDGVGDISDNENDE